MKLVVGLGNPGEKYRNNRHNVGFMVVDVLAERKTHEQWSAVKKLDCLLITIRKKLILAKSQTFMNSSGKSVRKLVNLFKIKTPELWVIHDDLDIKLGEYKIQKGKGPKDHKGLLSIYKTLGTKDFWHVRVGVENRTQGLGVRDQRLSGEDYVLQDFGNEELVIIKQIIGKIVKDLIDKLTN